jgi:hypothetical protein
MKTNHSGPGNAGDTQKPLVVVSPANSKLPIIIPFENDGLESEDQELEEARRRCRTTPQEREIIREIPTKARRKMFGSPPAFVAAERQRPNLNRQARRPPLRRHRNRIQGAAGTGDRLATASGRCGEPARSSNQTHQPGGDTATATGTAHTESSSSSSPLPHCRWPSPSSPWLSGLGRQHGRSAPAWPGQASVATTTTTPLTTPGVRL